MNAKTIKAHVVGVSTEHVHQNNKLLNTAGAVRYLKLAGDLS